MTLNLKDDKNCILMKKPANHELKGRFLYENI